MRLSIRRVFFNRRPPRIEQSDYGDTLFNDAFGKKHQYAVNLTINTDDGEVRGAIVVDLVSDKEWLLK